MQRSLQSSRFGAKVLCLFHFSSDRPVKSASYSETLASSKEENISSNFIMHLHFFFAADNIRLLGRHETRPLVDRLDVPFVLNEISVVWRKGGKSNPTDGGNISDRRPTRIE